MSSSAALPDKFASVPAEHLDLSGPDVFESPDVPGSGHHPEMDSDDDDDYGLPVGGSSGLQGREDLNQESLDPSAARQAFKGKYLRPGDFSDAVVRRPETRLYELKPRGYLSSASQPYFPELRSKYAHHEQEPESPLARLRRLRIEMQELEEQLDAEQQQPPPDPEEVSPGVLLHQLKFLKADLSRLSDPSSSAHQPSPSHAQDNMMPAQSTSAHPSTAQGPEPSMVSLTAQVDALERLIGTPQDSDLPPPVLPTLDRLSHQLSLLTQPRHLDTLNRRIKTLVSDLERIHDARRKMGDTTPLHLALSSGLTVSTPDHSNPQQAQQDSNEQLPPDILPRLQALFQLLPRLQALVPLAPGLLLRLRSLAELHASSAGFDSSLKSAQEQLSRMQETHSSLSEVLGNVQQSLHDNQGAMQANMQSVEQRVKSLSQRVDALQS